MVEGARFSATRKNPANNGVQILQHVSSGNPQDSESGPPQYRQPCLIPLWAIAEIMSLPIDLNNQAAPEAGKIGSDLADWKLPPELKSVRTPAKLLP